MNSIHLRLRLPSPALILSCVALFAALGGGAYAATSSSSSSITWKKATLGNGWKNIGGSYAPASYAKDSLGVVHLRGGVYGGTSPFVFTLPKNLRPKHFLALLADTHASIGEELDITPSGTVSAPNGDNTGFTSLDGISFVAGE